MDRLEAMQARIRRLERRRALLGVGQRVNLAGLVLSLVGLAALLGLDQRPGQVLVVLGFTLVVIGVCYLARAMRVPV